LKAQLVAFLENCLRTAQVHRKANRYTFDLSVWLDTDGFNLLFY
jgi:hypothetical protein